MRRLLPLLLLLAWPVVPPAAAQDPPVCTDTRDGAVACMAGRLCSCGYQRGGSVSGRPEGWRWDCGILRPACGEALPPPGIQAIPQPLPQIFMSLPAPDHAPGYGPGLRPNFSPR
jgi:hypothetical protein